MVELPSLAVDHDPARIEGRGGVWFDYRTSVEVIKMRQGIIDWICAQPEIVDSADSDVRPPSPS